MSDINLKPCWMLLEDFLGLPQLNIEPEVLEVLKKLDELGFHFRAISEKGTYFECKRGSEVKRFEP